MAMIEGTPETIFSQAVPFTFRLKLPANYEIPAHHHPFIEHATVISGTLHMGYGDKCRPFQFGNASCRQRCGDAG